MKKLKLLVFMAVLLFSANQHPRNSVNSLEFTSSIRNSYYQVFQNGKYIGGFSRYDDALAFAQQYENTHIASHYGIQRIWDNYPPIIVYTSNTEHKNFDSFGEAVNYARDFEKAFIYHKLDDSLIWSNSDAMPEKKQIHGVARIEQLPELPRGCEVTSLAMLINYKGIIVSKMELAERIEKNPATMRRSGGVIYYGDPNEGFVGDMYDISKNGLGVYHGPITKLLAEFFPYSAIDLTGCEFPDLYGFINKNRPVWVIINSTYEVLSAGDFEKWLTPDGREISITYKEHSVLVTGYDIDNIYFVDPLKTLTSLPKAKFIEIWEQMGRQAVSVSS